MGLRMYCGLLLLGSVFFLSCSGDGPLKVENPENASTQTDKGVVAPPPGDLGAGPKDVAPEVSQPSRILDGSVTEVSQQDQKSSQPDPGVARPLDMGVAEEVEAEPVEIKFVAMGDAGKANEGQKLVAKAIKEKCDKDGCDFVILLGDNIYDSGVDSLQDKQWQDK